MILWIQFGLIILTILYVFLSFVAAITIKGTLRLWNVFRLIVDVLLYRTCLFFEDWRASSAWWIERACNKTFNLRCHQHPWIIISWLINETTGISFFHQSGTEKTLFFTISWISICEAKIIDLFICRTITMSLSLLTFFYYNRLL